MLFYSENAHKPEPGESVGEMQFLTVPSNFVGLSYSLGDGSWPDGAGFGCFAKLNALEEQAKKDRLGGWRDSR